MMYRVVTYDRATEQMKGSLIVPPSVLAKVKKIAGFKSQDDGLGDYPLDGNQTDKVAKLLGFKSEPERFYYSVEPYEASEEIGFGDAESLPRRTRV